MGERRPHRGGWVLWMGAITATALGCSSSPGGGGKPDGGGGNSQPTIARITIAPIATLFTAPGQARALTAHAFDDQGDEVAAQFTWASTRPGEVSVDASGLMTAKALGSAQVSASAGGVTSAGCLVVVAEPATGAVLVADAQVVSIGPVTFTPPEPGVGTQYEVRLRNVSPPPAVGTMVIASEASPVVGRVVSTRDEPGVLVVTLELRPMPEVFRRYHIDWELDVVSYDVEGVLTGNARSGSPDALLPRSGELATHSPRAEVLRQIQTVDCHGEIKAGVVGKTISLAPTSSLKVVSEQVRDDPNQAPSYVKTALLGEFGLQGTIELTLDVNVNATGTCDFNLPPISIPVLGPVSALILPQVRLGVGIELSAKLTAVTGSIGVVGKVAVVPEVGWECGPNGQPCRPLANLGDFSDVKPKFEVPSRHQMEVELTGKFYGFIGLEAAILGGLAGNFGIAEAKLGPQQKASLSFEDDQAVNESLSSKYDLSLVWSIGPGPGLRAVLKEALGDDVSLDLTKKSETPISKSPRGTFTVDKPKPAIGEQVKFTVDITGGTESYVGIGYNIVSIEFYRRKENEEDFTYFEDLKIVQTASNQTHFEKTWKPKAADLGKNEFAAFVHTEVHDTGLLPLLEIADNTVTQVEVLAICAPQSRVGRGPAGGAPGGDCSVAGSLSHSVVIDSPGVSGRSDSHATVHFTQDPDASTAASVVFRPEGTCGMTLTNSAGGCTTTATSTTCTIETDRSALTVTIDDSVDPPIYRYNALVGAAMTLHETIECPTGTTTFDTQVLENLMTVPVDEQREVAPGGQVQGTRSQGAQGFTESWTWDLTLELPNQPPPPPPISASTRD